MLPGGITGTLVHHTNSFIDYFPVKMWWREKKVKTKPRVDHVNRLDLISFWRQISLTNLRTVHSCSPYDGNKFHPPMCPWSHYK